MAEPIRPRSQRFTKAARAEIDRLSRRRARLAKKRERLQDQIDGLDQELEAVDRETALLEELASAPSEADEIAVKRSQQARDPSRLSGHAIRATAVPLLLRERGTAPIHYREWLDLLTSEGFAVDGKRPDAVFLNQVVRSPLVRATTKSGYYVLEPGVVEELRKELRRQQLELARYMAEMPDDPEAFEGFRQEHRRLNTGVARTERQLEEALVAVNAAQSEQASDAKAA
jgi:predicted nuclease with TOPRIM domain